MTVTPQAFLLAESTLHLIIIGEKNWTLLATLCGLLSLYTTVDETKSITIIF